MSCSDEFKLMSYFVCLIDYLLIYFPPFLFQVGVSCGSHLHWNGTSSCCWVLSIICDRLIFCPAEKWAPSWSYSAKVIADVLFYLSAYLHLIKVGESSCICCATYNKICDLVSFGTEALRCYIIYHLKLARWLSWNIFFAVLLLSTVEVAMRLIFPMGTCFICVYFFFLLQMCSMFQLYNFLYDLVSFRAWSIVNDNIQMDMNVELRWIILFIAASLSSCFWHLHFL